MSHERAPFYTCLRCAAEAGYSDSPALKARVIAGCPPHTNDERCQAPAPPLAGAAGEGEKTDFSRAINGYAPGSYFGRCYNCKQEFTGDKRAVSCPKCAYNAAFEFYESENATLRARLAEETHAAAEAEREKRALHEELRGLRADATNMNSQIGAAHRIIGEWIAECGKRTEGRKVAEQELRDLRELMLAGLKEAYGQAEWGNIYHIIENLKVEIGAAGPLLGDEGKEGQGA